LYERINGEWVEEQDPVQAVATERLRPTVTNW
jgi:hypothetical protein